MDFERKAEQLIELARRHYHPNWSGFSDPDFREDEVDYKRATVEKARELLNENEFRRLIEEETYQEILDRLQTIGQDNNLLWRAVPRSGDLGILYQENLDKSTFCEAVFDLLYGKGLSEKRLQRYVAYVIDHDLPNKWTFPTYFLFMRYPETEMFVKPMAAQWFFDFMDHASDWDGRPNRQTYTLMKELAHGLWEAFQEYGCQDIIGVQSMIWVAYSTEQLPELADPFSEIFVDWQEAAWTFDFLAHILQRLGVEDADDPRFALTLRDHPPRIHLDFGNWLIFGLEAPESANGRVHIPLFDSEAISDKSDRSGSFSQPEAEEQISLYYVSLERLQKADSELRAAYDDVLDFIANRFGGWKASNYRKYNIDQLGEAAFDENKREKLLDKGLEEAVEPIRERQIWWVNQGKTLEAEREGGFLWAPLESKAGYSLYHWDTMEEVKKDDVILHYANGELCYVSQVTSEAIITENPHQQSAGDREWKGRLVEVDYHELPSPLSVDVFVNDLMELDIAQGPIDSHGGVKQGYLFRFTWEGLGTIQSAHPTVSWPEFVPPPPSPPTRPIYPLEACTQETGFDQILLERWVRAIERKKQAIIYGPPGTGKTYIAEHLAKHLIGGGDGFDEILQFHPAYAYEDFIQGLRPRVQLEGGLEYRMVPGRFLSFCRRARSCHGRCVLIIDEINRANLSRVFGELMYLLEYRNQSIPLAGGESLSIPGNVRIIGTMNTADRSIALVDHALRRRFAFLALYPDYDVLRHYHEREETGFALEGLIHILKTLNRRIDDRHYHVGITFFLRKHLEREIEDIWRMEIEPYLEEYFFDQPGEVESFRWEQVRDDICQS